jgi:hypothetical protein
MADEAFALSPISARAAQPSEEDYDAIRDAFMETSRGRWFLGEYAKRNRNADTSMVLDAVARIEENLAAQRHQASHGELAEALAAIRKAVDDARAAASIAIDGLALEQTLAPIRKGARVVREIAWRWREIGTDGRICDLLDSQVNSIEAGCGRIASIDPRGELGAAFDLIAGRIAEFDDSDTTPPRAAETAAASPSPSSPPAPPNEVSAAAVNAAPAAASPEAATGTSARSAEVLPATEEAEEISAEAAAAHDDAVLDMVAMEMAAPDPFEADLAEIQVPEPPPARSEFIARRPEPAAAPVIQPAPRPLAQPSPQPSPQPSLQHSLQPSLEPSRAPSLEPSRESSREPSLGSSLIASGILSKPKASGPDPLAPIRRMSQAEKLAFFS